MKRRFFWIGILVVLIIIILIKNYKNINFTPKLKGSVSITKLLSQAKELEDKTELSAAKATYQRLIAEFSNSGQISLWQKKVEDLNIRLLFSSVITKGSLLYEIKPGDTLTKIAQEFNTTVDLIKKANNLRDDKILPGRKIKVFNQAFSTVVDKSQNTLILKSDEEIIKTYTVSTGINNSTPTGNFKITTKLLNPTWFKAGAIIPAGSPENILGSRWLGFDLLGYGIHGTTEPQSLGKQVTQGCVRMSNQDIEELYIIVPLGTEVGIVD